MWGHRVTRNRSYGVTRGSDIGWSLGHKEQRLLGPETVLWASQENRAYTIYNIHYTIYIVARTYGYSDHKDHRVKVSPHYMIILNNGYMINKTKDHEAIRTNG